MLCMSYRNYKIYVQKTKNQNIYLLKSYTSVSSKPSKHIYIYIYIWGYMCVFFIYNSVFVRFSPQDFHIIPGEFRYLPGEKFTARSHSENFFKIWNFPRWVKPSLPGYRDRVSKLPRIVVARDFSPISFKLKTGILPPLIKYVF